MRFAVSAFYFCMGFSFASWASRIPDIKTKLHLNEAQLGTVLLCLPVGQLLMMPFSGRLVTKYGSKKILSFSIILYTLELTNIGWASEMWQLGLALFVFGVVGNLSNISVNTQGVLAQNVYGRPIMTTFHGIWSLSGLTGALVGLLMVNLKVPPHPHFFIIASLVIITVIIAWKYLIAGTSAPTGNNKLYSKPEGVLIKLGIIAFCSMAAEGAMFDWSGVYFREVVKSPASMVILGYTSFMIMMTAGRFMGDQLIAKVGRKKVLQFSGILVFTGLTISVLFPWVVTAAFGFMIVGLGASSVIPTIYSTAASVSKKSPGMALAGVSSIGFLGFLFGPPLIGYIAQLFSLRASFGVVAIFGLLITIMVTQLNVINESKLIKQA